MTDLSSTRPAVRHGVFALLYAVQGIPTGLLLVAVPGWLAARGAPPSVIGAVGAGMAAAFAVKLLLAPWMDRWGIPRMGRRRPWVLAAHVLLALTLASLAAVGDPIAHPAPFVAGCALVALAAAAQDAAVDGMAIVVVPTGERGRTNGAMYGGQVVGAAVAGIGGAAMLRTAGPAATFGVAAFGVALSVLVPVAMLEHPEDAPWGGKVARMNGAVPQWDTLRAALSTRPGPSAFVLFAAATSAEGVLRVALPMWLVGQQGWSEVEHASLMGAHGVMSGIAAWGVGLLAVDRWGGLHIAATAFAVAALAHLGAAALPASMVGGSVLVLAVTSGAARVAITAFAMDLCDSRVATTQFAVYMATLNLGAAMGAAVAAGSAGWVGPGRVFGSMSVLLLLAALRIRALEAEVARPAVGR